MRGDEAPHAPHLAVTATPWPGATAVWVSAEQAGGYSLNATIPQPSVMGHTLAPLSAARPGVWDRGLGLRIRVKGGTLESATPEALMSGANLLAIGDGSSEGWELLQFADARLISAGVWEISTRLRGQAGTDALMPDVWPVGSIVVLLDGAAEQVDLAPTARNQLRHWRIGPASRSPDDASYRHIAAAFRGAGLRPLSPCHLELRGRVVSWIRRTRISGRWLGRSGCALGEAQAELHSVRLVQNGNALAQAQVAVPTWTSVPQEVWSSAMAGAVLPSRLPSCLTVSDRAPMRRG
ncbi:MAG: hypothetical protein U1E55_11630 [Paracoccus sp. (in: a-proteobacteria)]